MQKFEQEKRDYRKLHPPSAADGKGGTGLLPNTAPVYLLTTVLHSHKHRRSSTTVPRSVDEENGVDAMIGVGP